VLFLQTGFAALAEPESRFSGATGGIVRFPNSNQAEDSGNLFGEAWLKLGYSLHKTQKGNLSVYALGNFVADSKPYAYNNTAKAGLGLSYSLQVNDALNLTFSARHDWFRERGNDVRRRGMRYAIDYYFYKYWPSDAGETMFNLPSRATIFKSYGTLAYPGSLIEGDDNVVLTLGGELSRDLTLKNSKWLVSPFVDADFAWDFDRNNYNNKIILGAGVKARFPLEKGEFFAGAKLQSDYRWINETIDIKPRLFLGWYKGF
jgi:hypothetical protein